MCNEISVNISKGDGTIYVYDLLHHERIGTVFGLKPDTYREAEWTEDDNGKSLKVRVVDDEKENHFRGIVLSLFPTRKKFLAFIERGESTNDVRIHQDGLLQWACSKENVELIEKCIKAGADVNMNKGYAIRWASANGHEKVVALLIKAGADVNVNKGYAIRWASANGHEKIVALLIEAGAKK